MWTALWAVYIIWGSTYLAIAVTVETMPPMLAVSTRFIFAGTIMAVVVTARGGTMRISRRAFLSCVLIGALLPGANAVLFYAEEDVPTGLASLLIASVPLWVVVLRLLWRERMPAAALAGVGVGFAGVAILLQPGGQRDHGRRRALPALRRHVVGRVVRLVAADDARRTRSPRPRGRCSPAAS